MAYFAGYQVFSQDLYADLHAGAAHIVHLTVNGDDIANIGGGEEVKSLNPCRHNARLAMFNGDNGGCLIDHTHDNPAMYVPMCVRVQHLHKSAGRAARIGNRPALTTIYVLSHLML